MAEPELFADISVILEYVQTYTEEHTVTNKTLSEFNGKIVLTQFCSRRADHSINNRLRLFDFIFREISKSFDKSESEKDQIDYICEDIIDYGYLNNNTPLELDEFLKDDLELLRDKLRNDGVDKFLMEMEVMDGYTDSKREKLERKVIDERVEIGQSHKMMEAFIYSHINNQIQARNLVKGGYWNRKPGERFVLVKHSCAARDKKGKIQDIISDKINTHIDIYSPVDIANEIGLSQ